MELKELAGVYCVDGVFTLEGVEKDIAERRTFWVPGDGRPDPLDEGCDAGGDVCGGVPRLPAAGSVSKNASISCEGFEYRRSLGSSRTSRDTCDGRRPGVFCMEGLR